MANTERLSVAESAQVGLSPGEPDLPAVLRCPSGHHAHYRVCTLDEHDEIPFYVCRLCRVVYRYGECRGPDGQSES